MQKECICGRKNTSEESVDDEDDDTEEETIVHTEVANEVYLQPSYFQSQ